MSSAGSVGSYRVGERVGPSVWKAEDTRNGKPVAIKILTKQLPKDGARREALIREVRVAAALYHHFLVPIIEVAVAGDNLVLVMELVDAQPFAKRLHGSPAARSEFFRMSYQLVDAVRFLHSKGLTHGNINADSVMLAGTGEVRLGGLNLTNLLPRPEGAAPAFQQKGADARSVAYMAPEQITGQTATEPRTDVYSLGVVMYEMSTGKLPYPGSNAADLARAIVEGQPSSPKAANPNIDQAILNVLGRCLFKDPYRRVKDAKALLEDIARADPQAARVAADLSATRPASASASAEPQGRQSILLMADVADYDDMAATDAAAASRAAARMQQVLGEAVYLFEGKVLDPFGKVMIAEMPGVDQALEAARKGEFDFSPDQQGATALPVRLLLHAGSVQTKNGIVGGDAVTRAVEVLKQLPPMQLFLSEEFVRQVRGRVRVRDAGARAGVKIYTIVAPEPAAMPAAPADVEEIAMDQAIEVAEANVAAQATPKKRSRSKPAIVIAAAAVAAIVLAIAGFALFRKSESEAPAAVAAGNEAAKVAVIQPVAIPPFAIEGPDPGGALAARGNGVRLATIEILRSTPGLRVHDAPSDGVLSFAGTLRNGEAGPEIVAASEPQSAPVPLPDAAAGIRTVTQWMAGKARVSVPLTSTEALNAFADAVVARAAGDASKTEAALNTTIAADGRFLPAHIVAMRFYAAQGKGTEAARAASHVMGLAPADEDLSRTAARLLLSAGQLGPAFAAYGDILKKNSTDLEALTHIARYAASAGDSERFSTALARLKSVPPSRVPVHAPDILVATGRMEAAIDNYYDIEVDVPDNPALAMKIGRISVLRRSLPIAELELKKLEQSDPQYGYHLLKAYIAATRNLRDDAERELELASAASAPGDDFWTSAAEVYAMLGSNADVLYALDKAAARKEPTSTYIMNNPLFRYLRSDEQFQSISADLVSQQNEIRTALAQIQL